MWPGPMEGVRMSLEMMTGRMKMVLDEPTEQVAFTFEL